MDLIFKQRKLQRVLSRGIGDLVLKGLCWVLGVVIVKNKVKVGRMVRRLFYYLGEMIVVCVRI